MKLQASQMPHRSATLLALAWPDLFHRAAAIMRPLFQAEKTMISGRCRLAGVFIQDAY